MMPRKKVRSKDDRSMPMVHPNAAAIDVGATLLMAAVRADRTSEPVRSFGTFTTDLHRLAAWFAECGVETVAMESTSVYWIPIYELLDARGFTVFLVNARDAKHVPGRKTDVSMRSGCSGFILTVCCAPAFGPKVISSRCAPTYVSASVCSSMRPRIFSTCRRR
jgi:hypothetical protein